MLKRLFEKKKYIISLISVLLWLTLLAIPVYAENNNGEIYGGGYAATGQVDGASYMAQVYDATSGLPTSDANYIFAASNGYIWVGGYSGIFRYDGNIFEKMSTDDGLTSGRGLFEDSKGRIWVATNDNGVVVLEGETRTHYTYEDGLPSLSIRIFAETPDGTVYIGTTAGVCYVDSTEKLCVLNDERLNEERVLMLSTDGNGKVYGITSNGGAFVIEDAAVSEFYDSEELGTEKITTILAEPSVNGKVYIGTDSSNIYYGNFGDKADRMRRISVEPMESVHWLNFSCGKVWVSSTTEIGYLEGDTFHVLDNIPFNSGIEMVTSDFQGNLWAASSTQGVMKVVTNSFINLTERSGLEEEVINATCVHNGKIYMGTDNGLRIISKDYKLMDDELTDFVGNARVRCICEDTKGTLWLSTYTEDLGVVCQSKEGEIKNYTTKDGLLNNQVRSLALAGDCSLLVGTNEGLAIIKGGMVVQTVGVANGVKNTVFLTVCEGDNGEIYAGSDGDGIYVIKGNQVEKIGREDGLSSDIVIRIKRDQKNGGFWIVTSNSIEYMKDGRISEITSFPYNNNYDLYEDREGNIWIISSYGIYKVLKDAMLADRITEYKHYSSANGMTTTPTANGYCTVDEEGNLYIPGRTGVCMVNIDHMSEGCAPVKTGISSIYFGNDQLLPEKDGRYIVPSSGNRIRITPAVFDYSMMNPFVKVYFEGMEEDGIAEFRNNLASLEYTWMKYGDYTLHIQALDNEGNILVDDTYSIVKQANFIELPVFRVLMFFAVAGLAALLVWRLMRGTIVKRQYEQIREAKEEAEQANIAKTRFLANMSHEIRTPINTIMGMNEMVLREDATGVPKPYFLSMMNYALDIRNASETLLSLINDLLDMSKIESGKTHVVEQEYDLQELLRSIVSMIRVRSTEKKLTFDVIIDEVLPSRLYGDAQKIKQIVLNLLTNALKYTEFGGFVLEVSMIERHDDQCKLKFSVKDTGIGVRQEDMEKLFTAYERLDEEKNSGIQGTGLGLDISRRFADLMGGSLTCESVYGEGSEFILIVDQKIIDKTPIGLFMEQDEDKAKGPYVPKFIAPDADILVVDDSVMNLNVIKGLLKPTKVFVTTAMSGEECLNKVRESHFDVVLLDHMMPGMDGVETMEQIREFDKDLAVYALTANTAVDEKFYISHGFTGYLSKPIDSELLERTLMKHIPDKILERSDTEETREALTEIPESMRWIYETEGMSAEEGIKNSGGIENYIFSLHLFLETIDSNIKVIKDSYDSGNIRLYTIKVHALKSSARIIGAEALSKMAEELENAGNRGDRAYIDENAGPLLETYQQFKEKLERLNEDLSDKPPVPEDELKDAYAALSDVIPQMDYDSVEMILESLSEYALPDEDYRKISEIRRMLKVFDWDGMEALIGGK